MKPNQNHSGDTEKLYRQHYLRADINLSSLVILIWLVTVVIYIPVDYQTLGATREFYFFLTARLIFTVGSIAIILNLRQTTDSAKYDQLISLILFMASVFSILGSQILKHDLTGQLIMNVLVIISIYAIIPGPIVTKIVISAIISIVSIIMLSKQEQALAFSQGSVLTGIVISNLLGFLTWYAITQFRRDLFKIHMELQKAKQCAEFLARTDSLTETSNRRAFMEKGIEEFTRALRYQRALSIILIDIDNFKIINDNHGHQAGDLVLKKFAQQVTAEIRKQDTLGRIGGDEFGLLLPETNKKSAKHIAERVCEVFSQTEISFHERPIKTSLSAGVASIKPNDDSFDTLLQRADQKLYQAKRAGKNRIQI